MGSSYSSKLRDARWQRKRLEVMKRDNWTCRSCGASGDGVTLNVHHAYYESGRLPWDYEDESLVTWCEDCHAGRHILEKCVSTALVNMEMRFAKKVAAMFARESANLELLAECEAAGIPCGEIENVLKFALNTRGAQ